MKMERTRWFSGFAKPSHIGLYECAFAEKPRIVVRRYWDGRRWWWTDDLTPTLFGMSPLDKWRGLANKP